MKLLRCNEPVPTIFDLVGIRENDMTAGLGFMLARSPVLTAHLLKDLVGYTGDLDEAVVQLQTHTTGGGITDVHVEIPEKVSIVIEAKRGPHLPSVQQLRKYVPALKKSGAPVKLLVALTNATDEFAATVLDTAIDGIDVAHRSWRAIKTLATKSRDHENHHAKRLLDEFITYLGGLTQMETKFSNLVYVVSIGAGNPEGWGLSWIDIVEKRRRYFYPVGQRWPDPPNYLGFRYGGRLQSIHHVKDYDLFTDPHTFFPEAPKQAWAQHYCFKLGPPIVPPHEVKAGPRVNWSARVTCMLDTLLTCKTISDALTETEKRRSG